MNDIECFTFVVKSIGAFFHNFVKFVLLSFLLAIDFFIKVASTALRPIQKPILLLSFLLVFLFLLPPEIIVWMMYFFR